MGVGTGHGFWLSGNVLWCNVCGAFAEGCGTMALARPCTGRRVRGSRQSHNQGGRNGLLQQLRNLQKGLYPRTRALLPPPIPIDASQAVPPEMIAAYSSQEGRSYQLATPETLSPALLPMLARIRAREAAASVGPVAPIVRRRASRKTTPGQDAASSMRNAHLMPSIPSNTIIYIDDG